MENLLHYYGFLPSKTHKTSVSVCEVELWNALGQVHHEDDSLSLRIVLLSALIKGFKDDASAPTVSPLRSLRGASLVTTEQQHRHPGHAARGHPFEVGARAENILMIYARALVVTNDDYARLGLRGLLSALASTKVACISAANEAAALKLLDIVLTSELHSMLSMSSLDQDTALLDLLEGKSSCGDRSNPSEKETSKKKMPNLAMCVRYRMQRKQILSRALQGVRTRLQDEYNEFDSGSMANVSNAAVV